MRLLMLVAVIMMTGQVCAAADPKEDAVKEEMAKLNGTWRWVSSEAPDTKAQDKAQREEQLRKAQVDWIIMGDKLTIKHSGKTKSEVTIKIDPTKTPKTMNLSSLELKSQARKTLEAIYRLEDDTLTICSRPEGMERPSEFTTGDSAIIFTYKRVKP